MTAQCKGCHLRPSTQAVRRSSVHGRYGLWVKSRMSSVAGLLIRTSWSSGSLPKYRGPHLPILLVPKATEIFATERGISKAGLKQSTLVPADSVLMTSRATIGAARDQPCAHGDKSRLCAFARRTDAQRSICSICSTSCVPRCFDWVQEQPFLKPRAAKFARFAFISQWRTNSAVSPPPSSLPTMHQQRASGIRSNARAEAVADAISLCQGNAWSPP